MVIRGVFYICRLFLAPVSDIVLSMMVNTNSYSMKSGQLLANGLCSGDEIPRFMSLVCPQSGVDTIADSRCLQKLPSSQPLTYHIGCMVSEMERNTRRRGFGKWDGYGGEAYMSSGASKTRRAAK